MSATPPPFEAQLDPQNSRACGAAALAMAYRTLGKVVPQDEIWKRIARRNRRGSLASTTYLMVQDALERGFSAVAVQARSPLQALRACKEAGLHAILNHRVREDLPTGHYTLLVDVDPEGVVVHDPYLGPSRRITSGELLELWRPRQPEAEIAGNVLIGVARRTEGPGACSVCSKAVPGAATCPGCKKSVPLHPLSLLGCVASACGGRAWNYVCCPWCDQMWTFTVLSAPGAAGAGASAPTAENPWNLGPLFAALDRFCDHVEAHPAVGTRPDVKQQVTYLRGSKERLRQAEADEVVHRKAADAQMAQMQEGARKEQAAHDAAMKASQGQQATPDGNALGQALLKNLGFVRG